MQYMAKQAIQKKHTVMQTKQLQF